MKINLPFFLKIFLIFTLSFFLNNKDKNYTSFFLNNNKDNIKFKEIYFSKNCMFFNCKQEYSHKVYKIGLLTIVKLENKYIREFIEHYFFLGVNKIIIYDNNEKNGEKMDEILKDYIEKDFVIIHNFRGVKQGQMIAYISMYKFYSLQFDYLMFLDVDEFLNINKYKNIHYLLRDKKYEKCDVIHIQWVNYDDNDLIHYDDRPLNIRFTRPNFKIFLSNLLVKSIFKSHLNVTFTNAHTPKAINLYKCDINGNYNKNIRPNRNLAIENNLTVPYIKHFECKTIEEFFLKLFRGDVYFSMDPLKIFTKKKFFTMNKWTQEKENIANDLINKYKNLTKKYEKKGFLK